MFDAILVNPAVELLKLLYAVTGNYGWAIVIFAVLVRAATWPLQLQQMRTQKAMARLSPQLEALKKKYKDDREKLTQAQMELYREHNVSMFGGCLPMLIQFPILIGLYNAIIRLSAEPAFATPFLWLRDLSQPEGIPRIWPLTQIWPDAPVGFPVLIVLMTITQFIQQQMMTTPSADAQQQQMASTMKWMPLIFAFFFINFASGLVLYWFVQNLAGIVLQYLFFGPSGLPLPALPWVRDDEPPAPPLVSGGVPATEPTITSSASTSAPAAGAGRSDSPKRRANGRNKKKRRG